MIATLQPFASYTVAVQACTNAGCGPFSGEIMAVTQQEGLCIDYILTRVNISQNGARHVGNDNGNQIQF